MRGEKGRGRAEDEESEEKDRIEEGARRDTNNIDSSVCEQERASLSSASPIVLVHCMCKYDFLVLKKKKNTRQLTCAW